MKTFVLEEEYLSGIKSNFLVMKRLNHPNIIKYEALILDPKKHKGWLIMELVNMSSLSKAVLKSEKDIKNIMYQIMETIHYLHS